MELVSPLISEGFGDTATKNTLILLNGQRLTNIDLSLSRFYNDTRDSIDRIEVIMGNSAVLCMETMQQLVQSI